MMEKTDSFATARGLLHQKVSMAHYDLLQIAPSAPLAAFVETYWIILWDLHGSSPFDQQNLPHPSQHLVIDPQGETGVFGIQQGVFNYHLAGTGRIFGVKFFPGAFHAFFNKPVRTLTNKCCDISAVFNASSANLVQVFLDKHDPVQFADEMEILLLSAVPKMDEKAQLAQSLVGQIAANPELATVRKLANASNSNPRALQRLFEAYIGVGPKWVIDRYRILDAVDALNSGTPINLTTLAHDLGYFDQAHFTKMFRRLTGKPPSFYFETKAKNNTPGIATGGT